MKIVQCSCLSKMGRFGNCLFQYSYARKYAELHDAILETPKWIGQELFGFNDPPISATLPQTACDERVWGRTNLDLNGYYQNNIFVSKLSRAELRKWFTFKPEWESKFPKIKPHYVAAHLRRGDYATEHIRHYALLSQASYQQAFKRYGVRETDVIWVSEEKPTIDTSLPQELSWLPDFMILKRSDILFRANSTFSWWAAVLGNGKVYSPVVGNKVGMQSAIPFVAGNHPKMCDGNRTGGFISDLYLPE